MNNVKFPIENVGFYGLTKELLTGLYMERSHLQKKLEYFAKNKKNLAK